MVYFSEKNDFCNSIPFNFHEISVTRLPDLPSWLWCELIDFETSPTGATGYKPSIDRYRLYQRTVTMVWHSRGLLDFSMYIASYRIYYCGFLRLLFYNSVLGSATSSLFQLRRPGIMRSSADWKLVLDTQCSIFRTSPCQTHTRSKPIGGQAFGPRSLCEHRAEQEPYTSQRMSVKERREENRLTCFLAGSTESSL